MPRISDLKLRTVEVSGGDGAPKWECLHVFIYHTVWGGHLVLRVGKAKTDLYEKGLLTESREVGGKVTGCRERLLVCIITWLSLQQKTQKKSAFA